jgi:hypothetical protein
MSEQSPIRTAFNLPPEQAVAYFRQKGYRIGFDHRDVWQQQHQAGFTVAKAMQLDLLMAIREQVDAAIELGTTFDEFKANLKPGLVKRGWWGKAMMTDPATGEAKEVQLGSPRRLKVIYDTNLRTAHAEGQWARIQETKGALPFLMYDHTPSQHERPEHKAWDGLVLPADDPWWQAHYPVKAWGCKCRVIQLGQRQLDRMGASVGTAPAEQLRNYTNKRTGETQQIPAGVDPEFAYPPGGRRDNLVSYMASRLERLPANLRPASARALMGESFSAWAAKPAGDWPIAILSPAHMAALKVETDVVRMSSATLEKQQRTHPELAASDYARVQDALDSGEAIQESEREIIFLVDEPSGIVAVVKATRTGRAVFVTSVRRLSGDDAKRDKEILRLRAKAKK